MRTNKNKNAETDTISVHTLLNSQLHTVSHVLLTDVQRQTNTCRLYSVPGKPTVPAFICE